MTQYAYYIMTRCRIIKELFFFFLILINSEKLVKRSLRVVPITTSAALVKANRDYMRMQIIGTAGNSLSQACE